MTWCNLRLVPPRSTPPRAKKVIPDKENGYIYPIKETINSTRDAKNRKG
jgi:hypothetical protein